MTQQIDQQVFDYARQFAGNAFKAQTVMLQGIEQLAGLQLDAFERQSRSAVEFFAAATEVRDAEGLRGLWDKSVAFSREQAEQAVSLGQGVAGVGRRTAESLGTLAGVRQAANDAAPGRKTAAK